MQHKIAAYNHMLNRLNIIPMNDIDYHEELQTIIYIAKQNGYTEHMIHKLNTKIKNKNNLQLLTTMYNTQANTNKYITLDYNKNTSCIINNIFKNHNYTIAFKTSQNLQQKLKPKHNSIIESGVYKLICNDCPKFYVGQTGRTFKKRFSEHTQELKNAHSNTVFKSNYAQHIYENGHTFTDINTNLHIIHHVGKSDTMDRLEELQIYKHRHNPLLLNDKINTKTNKIYDMILHSDK